MKKSAETADATQEVSRVVEETNQSAERIGGAGEGGDAGQGAGDHAGVTGPHTASAAARMTGASL